MIRGLTPTFDTVITFLDFAKSTCGLVIFQRSEQFSTHCRKSYTDLLETERILAFQHYVGHVQVA